MAITFRPPAAVTGDARHHAEAVAANIQATTEASAVLASALSGKSAFERLLLKAAAGAGKSYALKRMVEEALQHPNCSRVAVTAFANKQLYPLAEGLGTMLGKDAVCLHVAKDRLEEIADSVKAAATVVEPTADVPRSAKVIISTSHKFGGTATGLLRSLGPGRNGELGFDVLFVDEAWQLPLHLYRKVSELAPIVVGVGDVGQLPPIDPGENPWRGDPGYNPYRAWPTEFEDDAATWAIQMPAVWRPTEAQLALWRAFYGDWDSLDCVAGPGDRSISFGSLRGHPKRVWDQVGTGVPTLLEVDGLDDPEAPDIDPPLLGVVERLLDALLRAGFVFECTDYDATGMPEGTSEVSFDRPAGDALITVLATRNQAVDDATEMVERLTAKHGVPEGLLVASTVDSWQGQTNGITVAVHPLSGASQLDEFNSAFGRLAVTCTRATHGLLLVSRVGLDDLLTDAPPRPGTPFGEPGTRQLPRQTHERILGAFARGTLQVGSA